MLAIMLKTLPFFGIIGLGFWAGKTRFFSEEATSYLTKFVFYFALSAMLFRFAANLSFAEVFNARFLIAYLCPTILVYLIAVAVAKMRGLPMGETAVEAQCATIGNVGFLGIPMLALLLGPQSVGPVMMVLAVDLIFFGAIIVIIITGSRDGRLSFGVLKLVGVGLAKNPMIVSISLGFLWSALALPIPAPMNEFLDILGGAATPGALFAIGASLAAKSTERIAVAAWLTFLKLAMHPMLVAISALLIFNIEPYSAGVMIAAASLPVAGNIFMLAQHYGVAPQRASAAILLSTLVSIATVSVVIAWVSGF